MSAVKPVEAVPARAEESPRPHPAPAAPPQVAPAAPQTAAPAEAEPRRRRGSGKRRLLMLSLPVALAVGGGIMWITGGRYVTTNNAYIHQPLVQVSADIAGRIAEVDVTENENVAAGTVMFKLDPKPYKIALDQANAALAAAQLQVTQLRAAYATAEAKLKAAQSLADISQREYERQKSLQSRGVASQSAVDSAHSAALSAENSVSLAQDGVSAAAAALGGNPQIATEDFPAVRAAMAQRETAQRNLSLATVKAPVPGVVSQVDSLNVGQYVTPGMLVASLVQTDKTWVEANFKETQLAGLKVGQPVTVAPDTYSGLKLAGKVQSIGSATGSQFSLIPAQNATGNWVKVVQRVPVRISVTPVKGMPLRDGMSVNVSVDTGQSRLDKLTSLR